jgi:hypothetical protein
VVHCPIENPVCCVPEKRKRRSSTSHESKPCHKNRTSRPVFQARSYDLGSLFVESVCFVCSPHGGQLSLWTVGHHHMWTRSFCSTLHFGQIPASKPALFICSTHTRAARPSCFLVDSRLPHWCPVITILARLGLSARLGPPKFEKWISHYLRMLWTHLITILNLCSKSQIRPRITPKNENKHTIIQW